MAAAEAVSDHPATRPAVRAGRLRRTRAAFPLSNTEASRAERYPLYLAQLECTLERIETLLAGRPEPFRSWVLAGFEDAVERRRLP